MPSSTLVVSYRYTSPAEPIRYKCTGDPHASPLDQGPDYVRDFTIYLDDDDHQYRPWFHNRADECFRVCPQISSIEGSGVGAFDVRADLLCKLREMMQVGFHYSPNVTNPH